MTDLGQAIRPTKTLYIDIDGVLLGRKSLADLETGLANGAERFLKVAVENYDCYWLTSHCKNGNARDAIDRLRPYANKRVLKLAEQIKPTSWHDRKTNAIDFSKDFLWVEDNLFESEKAILAENGCLDKLIEIDTRERPDDLLRATEIIKSTSKV